MTEDARRGAGPWALVHLCVLSACALAQPLFGALKPEFFLANDAAQSEVVVLALLVTFLPPALIFLASRAAGRISESAGTLIHCAAVASLLGIFVSDLLGPEHGALRQTLAATIVGVLGATMYWRVRAARMIVSALAPLPVLFLALFVMTPPVSRFILASEPDEPIHQSRANAPVVVVVFDELPTTSLLGQDGRVDAAWYPNFARLARSATWFRNASTLFSGTELAVPTLLTGSAARQDVIPTAAHYPRSLFSLLAGTHELHVVEPATDLCPERLCPDRQDESAIARMGRMMKNAALISAQGWLPAFLRARVPQPEVGRITDRGAEFRSFVRAVVSGSGPQLHFLHILLPHTPWHYSPSGRRYGDVGGGAAGLNGGVWTKDRWLVGQAYQRHLLQLAYTDRLLGSLLGKLRSTGLFGRALVVVTADHGVSFRPGDLLRAASPGNAHDLLGVPLFVKRPGQRRGRISDRLVRSVDVVPTVADALGVRLGWPVSGRSALRPLRRSRVAIQNGFDPEIVLTRDGFVTRQRAALNRKIDMFGHLSGPDGLYAFGPEPDLIGRSPRPLLAGFRDSAAAEPQDECAAKLQPSADRIPMLVETKLSGIGPGPPVAFAMNGRIVGTTMSYQQGKQTVASVLIPEEAFARVGNILQVFAIRRAPDHGLELERLPATC